MDKTIFQNKKFVTNSLFIKKALELKLSLEEFLMLTFFDNDYNEYLNIESLSEVLGFKIDESYRVFNSLISKKLITIETEKDLDGRMVEKVNLDNFYNMIVEEKINDKKKSEKEDIFAIFEKEFARTITSMEYEIINAWISKGYSEELIIGALKEAVYNGVNNLRYIDKILYEWNKKGFKTCDDVNNFMVSRNSKKDDAKELFEYNWLDEDE